MMKRVVKEKINLLIDLVKKKKDERIIGEAHPVIEKEVPQNLALKIGKGVTVT